jgi:ATP-dependent helicase HrpA
MAGSTTEMGKQARSLPIYDAEQSILEALEHHQVIIVEGPTGCGKTTQLPRMLLRAGLTRTRIGITQPRRIAAVSVATRIAAEEGVPLGEEVGYAIRFDEQSGPNTVVRVMTDGILLQEARSDPWFSRYDVIMVDEAHERSVNIDFLLGLLHRAVAKRDDLRVIVSSATLNPELFQRYFADVAGEVPLISVEARTFPVEIHHRAPESDDNRDVVQAAAREVVRIHRSGREGHILVFMPGEAMIKNTDTAIFERYRGDDLVVLPLYGRLTREEQERVFDEFDGRRKVVIATNIAETSITIAGTCFVVDSGLAKVPRVSTRTGIATLREEGVSRASASQRSGRAGRTAPGEVIRLYTRKDLARRPEYTDEEFIRLDLSDVFLRLIDLGVGRVEDFPLPTRPPRGKARAALEKLMALGAIDEDQRLTQLGHRMVPFPLDPTLSRVVVEAADRFPDVVKEVCIVGATMSGRSPYLFPPEFEDEARRAHKALAHPLGDAVTAVVTYKAWERAEDQAHYCAQNYLDPDTMNFIEKTTLQLSSIAEQQGVTIASGGDPAGIVRSLAAGFAHRILRGQGRVYTTGHDDTRIAIHPASTLFHARPRFVVAAEIVISRRAYARHVSVLHPEWLADVAPDLARKWRAVPKGRKKTREWIEPAKVPPHLKVGPHELPLRVRRGDVMVEIPIAACAVLGETPLTSLPSGAENYKARVSSAKYRFFVGMPLGKLMGLLPHVPLPRPKENLQKIGFEGALLEADRDMHTIARHLHKIGTPMLPSRGKRPGWVMLVGNGADGFWYEVTSDFREVIATSLDALRALSNHLGHDEKLRATVDSLVDAKREQLVAVDLALGTPKVRGVPY